MQLAAKGPTDDTRDIAARPLDACDQTNSDRVGSNDEIQSASSRLRLCLPAPFRRRTARELDVAKELLPELANQHRLPFIFGMAIRFHIRNDSRCGSVRKGRR